MEEQLRIQPAYKKASYISGLKDLQRAPAELPDMGMSKKKTKSESLDMQLKSLNKLTGMAKSSTENFFIENG